MAKGYWIARVDVKNEKGFNPYAAANAAIFKKFGGHYLVRGAKFDAVEGNSRAAICLMPAICSLIGFLFAAQCLLWVKSGRDALKFRCPLYLSKRTLIDGI